MKRYLAAAAFVLFAAPVSAQDLQALADDYVNMPAVQAMIDSMFSADAMAQQFSAMLPPEVPMSDVQLQQIGEVMAGGMASIRPRIEEVMTESTAQTFTVEELEALIAFYSSDIGASILLKTQEMMASFMTVLGPEMLQMQQSVLPEIMAIMEGGQ